MYDDEQIYAIRFPNGEYYTGGYDNTGTINEAFCMSARAASNMICARDWNATVEDIA